MHLANRLLTPDQWLPEGGFPVPLRAVSGKPIAVMLPRDCAWGSIALPDSVAARYQPDFGLIYDTAGCPNLSRGDVVAIRPYAGVWLGHEDFDWIPVGRQIKILGTVDDWSDNVLAKVIL